MNITSQLISRAQKWKTCLKTNNVLNVWFIITILLLSTVFNSFSQYNDPYLFTDTNRRIKWDSGNFYRDLWQWDFTPVTGYQCKVYDGDGIYYSQYNEPPSVGADLGIFRAWETTRGVGVIIAIADQGCDNNHPDLTNRIVGGTNVFDLMPWSYDVGPANIGHGTAVSSVVAAEGNNGLGIVGVAPEASLFIIRCNYSSALLPAIVDAAISAGASIIVMSWSFSDDNQLAKQALIRAGEHGIVVVCATLNISGNVDGYSDYPTNWQLPNVITVTSCMMNDVPYSVGGTSSTLVHLYAPGRLIIVAKYGETGYVYTSGTSFAAPKVAGALALIRSAFPNLTAKEAIDRLLASVDRLPAYAGKTITGGRLNVGWAITGPEISISVQNGLPVINIQGPAFASFKIERTTNFNQWDTLPVVQSNISGLVSFTPPLDNMGFFKISLTRPETEWMSFQNFVVNSSKKLKQNQKNHQQKMPPVRLSEPQCKKRLTFPKIPV